MPPGLVCVQEHAATSVFGSISTFRSPNGPATQGDEFVSAFRLVCARALRSRAAGATCGLVMVSRTAGDLRTMPFGDFGDFASALALGDFGVGDLGDLASGDLGDLISGDFVDLAS